MKIEEVWAVDHGRIAAFFEDQPDTAGNPSGFTFQGCRITVTPLEPRRIAGMALPQTRVAFEGKDAVVIAIYRRFQLRFLSAGG